VLRRLLPATVLFALLAPASAQADQGAAVIRDCLNHGRIQGHYSQKAYSQALAEMPADVTEYSDCPNLIRQARLAAASGQGGSGAGGGAGGASGSGGAPSAASFTPSERQALASAGRRGGAAVNLGGQVVRPGVIHADAASALNSLPTPLLALLIALAAGALAAVGFVGTKRVRARRPD
jgi:hypothetical protein